MAPMMASSIIEPFECRPLPMDPSDIRDSQHPQLRDDSLLIHADLALQADSSTAPPIHQTSTFRAGSAEQFADMATRARHPRYYTRYGNPTLARVEAVLAALEGAEAALVMA